jgi:hypothetical protein
MLWQQDGSSMVLSSARLYHVSGVKKVKLHPMTQRCSMKSMETDPAKRGCWSALSTKRWKGKENVVSVDRTRDL